MLKLRIGLVAVGFLALHFLGAQSVMAESDADFCDSVCYGDDSKECVQECLSDLGAVDDAADSTEPEKKLVDQEKPVEEQPKEVSSEPPCAATKTCEPVLRR